MAVFAVLILLSYLIVAWMYGGKYIVHFTMDENHLIHEQEPAQSRRAKKLRVSFLSTKLTQWAVTGAPDSAEDMMNGNRH